MPNFNDFKNVRSLLSNNNFKLDIDNNILLGKQGIHIKKKNKGKFTDYCGGKVTDSCIQQAKNSNNPTLRKRAIFAENARKWKHQDGGILHSDNPVIDSIIEFTPVGDIRDIYEGFSNGNYNQSIQGAIGLGSTILGVGVIPKLLKARKLIKKAKLAKKLLTTTTDKATRQVLKQDILNGVKAYKSMADPRLVGSIAGKSIDTVNDTKSIVTRKHGGNINKFLMGGFMNDPEDEDFSKFTKAIHGNVQSAQKAKQLYYDLKNRGLSESQAASAVVTAGMETGGTYNPNMKSKSGYKGLFQWNSSKFPGWDYNTQVNTIANQIKDRKYYTKSFNLVSNPDSTTYQVGYGITNGYVRGGNPRTRGNLTQKYFGMTNNKK